MRRRGKEPSNRQGSSQLWGGRSRGAGGWGDSRREGEGGGQACPQPHFMLSSFEPL